MPSPKPLRRVLIANRGEIAVRIARACRELGIESVAVYSEPDRTALHVQVADFAYPVGPAPSSQSYLVVDNIIAAAKATGADAIHPGYGFLAENAAFARRCAAEGITFVGPTPDAIIAMGDKVEARKRMIAAGVPVVPGSKDTLRDDEVAAEAERIGYPVMLKASAGGGGKGMRMIPGKAELASALRAVRSEAKSSFGDDRLYLEKFVLGPHHVEVQVLADTHGHTVHVFERECSVQRRHQKVIEESPSPFIDDKIRHAMGEVAVKAAASVGYVGAGTIEFMVGADKNFYFLEMNTRIQVEHPITEMVTGIDLVQAQLRIAGGEPLPWRQQDIAQRGHAIECRIYAEDPVTFFPAPGKISLLRVPSGIGIRDDSSVYEGAEVTVHYDPMISKLVAWGADRDEAIRRMLRALAEYRIQGPGANIAFHRWVLEHPRFRSGNYDTNFIPQEYKGLPAAEDGADPSATAIIAAVVAMLERQDRSTGAKAPAQAQSAWRANARREAIHG
ncbi:MAG TPA: acetyl-CoA carboxylase biotin carboxylase subunit [Candidatus Binatia bacterium]|jgi:acetyl-CoA carboxylase biotin carboxylase subunit